MHAGMLSEEAITAALTERETQQLSLSSADESYIIRTRTYAVTSSFLHVYFVLFLAIVSPLMMLLVSPLLPRIRACGSCMQLPFEDDSRSSTCAPNRSRHEINANVNGKEMWMSMLNALKIYVHACVENNDMQ